jgi:hypothetical protein
MKLHSKHRGRPEMPLDENYRRFQKKEPAAQQLCLKKNIKKLLKFSTKIAPRDFKRNFS